MFLAFPALVANNIIDIVAELLGNVATTNDEGRENLKLNHQFLLVILIAV